MLLLLDWSKEAETAQRLSLLSRQEEDEAGNAGEDYDDDTFPSRLSRRHTGEHSNLSGLGNVNYDDCVSCVCIPWVVPGNRLSLAAMGNSLSFVTPTSGIIAINRRCYGAR